MPLWGGFRWFCSAKQKTDDHHSNHRHHILTIKYDDGDGDDEEGVTGRRHDHPTAMIVTMLKSWLNGGRRIRYLFLALCSPVLIPILCFTFPILFATEVCVGFCCRRRRVQRIEKESAVVVGRGDAVAVEVTAAAAAEEEPSLMDRYLEDQLVLALESVKDCIELGFCADEIGGFVLRK